MFKTDPYGPNEIRVECADCSRWGVVKVDTEGDINAVLDLQIENAWCLEHLPDHLRRKEPSSESRKVEVP